MTNQHLPNPDLPVFDIAKICPGINARIADIRRRRVLPIPGGERAADKGLWAEER